MYLPAVDYVAFRIETSQFHDFEPKKKLPSVVSLFYRFGPTAYPRGFTASSQLVTSLNQSGSILPLCKFLSEIKKERKKIIARNQSRQNAGEDQNSRMFGRF